MSLYSQSLRMVALMRIYKGVERTVLQKYYSSEIRIKMMVLLSKKRFSPQQLCNTDVLL